MRFLRVYLWKEWREQRWILAGLAGGLVVAMTILAVFLPARTWRPGFTYDWVVGMCVLAALFTVGSDLLSREMRRERLQFLERAPAGLRMAFAAKLIFFVAVMAGAIAFGIALAGGVAWARTGALPQEFFETLEPWMVPALVGVMLWTFAVSSWVPSGAMALPSALLLLAAFCLPCWFAGEAYGLTTVELVLCAALALVGALGTALWSFVVGAGRSRSRRFVVLGGLGVAALSFAPSWALAAVRHGVVLRGETKIVTAWIGAGEQYAWMTVGRYIIRPRLGGGEAAAGQCHTALLVDLETREGRYLGPRDASWVGPSREWIRSAVRLVVRDECTQFRLFDEGGVTLFDGRTAQAIPPGASLDVPELGVAPADFGLASFDSGSARSWMLGWAGLGYRLRRFGEGADLPALYYDPFRDVCVNPAELKHVEAGVHFSTVWICPGRWLAVEQEPDGQDRNWVWLDPETGKREPWEFAYGNDEIYAATVDDGSLLLWREDGVSLLDPETGRRRRIEVSGGDGESPTLHWFRLADPAHGPLEAGSRHVVLVSPGPAHDPQRRYDDSHSHGRPALLDLAAGEIEWPPVEWELPAGAVVQHVSTDGPRLIGIEDEERLVRYDFDAATREVIFSVDQLSEE